MSTLPPPLTEEELPLVFIFLFAGPLAGGSVAFRLPLVVAGSAAAPRFPLPRVLGRAGSLSSDAALAASLAPRAEPEPDEPPPFI